MQMMILLVLFHSFVPDCNNYYSNMLLNMYSCFRVLKVDFNRNYFSYVKKIIFCLHYATKNTVV